MRAELHQRYSGLRNAHEPLLLQEGMKAEQLSITPEDAQFLATRSFQVW
jgi:phage portal protein BeeE